MPNELRILDFSYKEVALALRQQGRLIKISFPEAQITAIRLDERDDTTLCLHLKSLRDGRPFLFPLSIAQTAACLISYCISQKIPLPRRGYKTIKLSPTGLILQISMLHSA